MLVSNPRFRLSRLLAVVLSLLQIMPVFAADPPKISVVPGTPNVWSMEQAHYLLNRLRANKDGLQTKRPSEDDLNPNAVNGLRLDALQSFLGVAASYDQLGGTQNKLALDSYLTSTGRRNGLIAQADARRAELQAAELQVIQLKQEQDLLAARKARAADAAEIQAIDDRSAVLAARVNAAQSLVAVLRGQVAALNDAAGGGAGAAAPPVEAAAGGSGGTDSAGSTGTTGTAGSTGGSGSAASAPNLAAPAADYNTPLKDKELLRSAFTSLVNSTASSFKEPRLHASQILDNFVDMQYEIVAKQLTTLRDEVGKGQRVVFLELPTSISAGARRKFPFVAGGEDRLAQSWWKLTKLYLAYDRENSACWMDGEDINDGLQSTLGFKQGQDVAEVPKGLRGTAGTVVDAEKDLQELQQLVSELGFSREKLLAAELAYDKALRERRDRESLVRQLTAIMERTRALMNSVERAPQIRAGRSPGDRAAELDRQTRSLDAASTELTKANTPLEGLAKTEDEARRQFERARKEVDEAEAKVHQKEAQLLMLQTAPAKQPDYYDASTRAAIAKLEEPCRRAQIDFAEKEKRYHDTEAAFKEGEEKSASVEEKLAAGKRAGAKIDEQTEEAQKKLAAEQAERATAERKRGAIQRALDDLNARTEKPAAEIARYEAALQAIEDELAARDRAIAARNAEIAAFGTRRAQIDSAQRRLEAEKKDSDERKIAVEEERKRLRNLEALKLRDQLELGQVHIYTTYGGVDGIHRAFKMDVRSQADAGIVRTIEMFPRQTALNVNSTHLLSNTTAVSFAMKYLFGLGAKVDYERMREKYDQFVQQEVFASGFGKGATEFGWTFGPNPGTRVLNPGLRTTYAALAVPANATGLEMEAIGCSFHHNSAGPSRFNEPGQKEWQCENRSSVTIGLPNRFSSGSFWVSEVRYSKVNPGQRATVVLRGMFSPETNVLVNGKRLTQVIGLGKPSVSMDNGAAEDQGNGVIWGNYEYVNEHYMTLSLNVPSDFKEGKFPTITLISPSRTATINWLPLSVNGKPGVRLDDEPLLFDKKPAFGLTGLTVVEVADGAASAVKHVTARLSGSRLSSLDRLWINGRDIDRRETVSDTIALIDFDDPGTPTWNITGVSNEATAEARSAQTLAVPNPVRVMIAGVKVSHVEYKKDAPSRVDLIVSGTAFRPELEFKAFAGNDDRPVSVNSYVAPERWLLTIPVKSSDKELTISVKDGDAKSLRFGPITIPGKESDPLGTTDQGKSKTTITEIQTQKTVTEKK